MGWLIIGLVSFVTYMLLLSGWFAWGFGCFVGSCVTVLFVGYVWFGVDFGCLWIMFGSLSVVVGC